MPNKKIIVSLLLALIFAASSSASAQTATRAKTQTAPTAKSYDVQHYTIRTSFDRKTRTVFGETTVELKPLTIGFSDFALDAVGLQIQSVTLEKSDKPIVFSSVGDKLNINLNRAARADESVRVTIKYKAVKPRVGLYFVDAVSRDGREVRPAQIWTQGEPEDNRHWFPSYDKPDDKATSEQFITVAADETAIANGELIETKTNADNTKTFHYRMNQPHPTYLTSLIVGKYAKVTDAYNNIPLGFYVYPGSEAIVPRAYGNTKKMFQTFENLTKIKFPWQKYDQTVVGAFTFGGMENITATTMADTEIYSALDPDKDIKEVENLVSHELAHSWFGNLVTCKDWRNLWLNEGFATFMESAYLEQTKGRAAYLAEMRINAEQYFAEEAAGIRHPLENQRAEPNLLLFDATTYKKGGFVAHMLRETVGDELFWKSINNYLNKHKLGNVETRDLQAAFEETTKRDLNWFFEQWTRKAGYPRLQVTPTYNPANKQLTVAIRQTQKPDTQTPAAFRLFAEVDVTTAAGTKTEKLEMTAREQIFTFAVAEKPTRIEFDPRDQILKRVEVADIK